MFEDDFFFNTMNTIEYNTPIEPSSQWQIDL